MPAAAEALLPADGVGAQEPQPEPQAELRSRSHGRPEPAGEPVQPRAARRQAARRPRRSIGKAFVTIVLLGVLATAVVVVLLQSAGVISWSFLGPVA